MPKRSGSYSVPFSFELLSFGEAVGLAADTGRISGDAGPLLETVVDMLDELGRPDEYFDCIQVAGTWVGSVVIALCATVLSEVVERRQRIANTVKFGTLRTQCSTYRPCEAFLQIADDVVLQCSSETLCYLFAKIGVVRCSVCAERRVVRHGQT